MWFEMGNLKKKTRSVCHTLCNNCHRQHWCVCVQVLGQLISGQLPFTVMLGNRLSVLHINLCCLLTESGFYLLFPSLHSSVLSCSVTHLSILSCCLSVSHFLILPPSILPHSTPYPPIPHPCVWYNQLWPLTWPMTTMLSGW